MSQKSIVYKSNEIPQLISITDCVRLNNGVMMPRLGIGTWFGGNVFEGLADEEIELARKATRFGLDAGFRAIDTAFSYGTEESAGKALRESGLNREDVFITTKYINLEMGYENTLFTFDESLKRLGIDYLDLYLIHWPKLYPDQDIFVEVWKAFEKLYKDGRVHAIGVSNFNQGQLERLFNECEIIPAVNQIELHPYFQQRDICSFCQKHGIQVEAWSVLALGRIFYDEKIKEIAHRYNKSETQLVLRWALQQGIITITRAERKEWILENANIYDFTISQEDMAQLSSLDTNTRLLSDPNDGPIAEHPGYLQKPE